MKNHIQQFLDWKGSYAPKAAENYTLHLERFLKFIGNREMKGIGTYDISRFSQALQKKNYSMANVAYSLIVIKNFFDFCGRQGIACLDPWLIKIPKYTTHAHATVMPEEFLAMDATLKEDEFYELQKKVALHILWFTGMRLSELTDLNISDIEAKNKKAFIRTKKNNKMRWVFWPEETHRLLLKFLGVRLCLNQNPALFIASEIGGRRERVSDRTMQRWIKEISKRAGIIKSISVHSFRHGRAHQILNNGGGVVDIQKILGHSDRNPQAAFSYLRLNPSEIEPRARRYF